MTGRVAGAVTAAMLVVFAAVAGPANAASLRNAGLSGLVACLAQQHRLNVDVMMDESGSLSESVDGASPTDPNNQRVGALQALLSSLAGLTSGHNPTSVTVALQGFSSAAETVTGFSALTPASLPALTSDASKFSTRDTGLDTDFYAAISAAQTSLAQQAAADDGHSCQVVLLFTDGVYSYATRSGVHRAFAPGGSADNPTAAAALAVAGQRALCGTNGPVDEVRADDDFLVAVGLGPGAGPGAQLLNGMALGGCGTRPSPGGLFLPASNVGLLEQIFASIAGTIGGGTNAGTKIGLPRSFELGADLSRVDLTSQDPTTRAPVTVTLTGPDGSRAVFAGSRPTTLDGIRWIRNIGADGLTTLTGTPTDDDAQWSGEWSVSTSGPDGAAISTNVIAYADLVPVIAAPTHLTIGAPSQITISLVRVSGSQPTVAEVKQPHTARLTIGTPGRANASILTLTATPGGTGFTGTYVVPTTQTSTSTTLTVDISSLSPERTVLTDAARSQVIPILAPASLPQPPTTIDFGRIDRSNSVTTTATFVGGTGAGCVAIGALSADDVPSGVRGTTVTAPAGCIPIPAGAAQQVSLRLTHTGRGSGRLSGDLAVTVKDANGNTLERQVPVTASFSDPVQTGRRWAIFVGLLVAGTLIPLVLIYLLALLLSRFRPTGTLRYATVPATVSATNVEMGADVSTAGGLASLFRNVPEGSKAPWRIRVPEALVLSSTIPRNPFRAVPASVDGGGLATVATDGSARVGNRWVGRLSTQLGASWVYVVRSVERDDAGNPLATGDLTILTAESAQLPRPSATALASAVATLPGHLSAVLTTLAPASGDDPAAPADTVLGQDHGSGDPPSGRYNSNVDFDPFTPDSAE